MHDWPAWVNAEAAMRAAAWWMSASAVTMTGVELPSSSATCLRGARTRMSHPTGALPVNEIIATSGWSTRARPTTEPLPLTRQSDPGGSPASSRIPARARAESGVASAGFSTTGQPAAIAGASLWATRFSGKLNGLIAPITPTGSRRVRASLPTPAVLASIGTTSPASRLAATAANVKVSTARAASPRAWRMGFPDSAAIVRASGSARSAISRAARSSTAARSAGGGAGRWPAATATARSTSSGDPAATRASSSPEYGLRTTRSAFGCSKPASNSSPVGWRGSIAGAVAIGTRVPRRPGRSVLRRSPPQGLHPRAVRFLLQPPRDRRGARRAGPSRAPGGERRGDPGKEPRLDDLPVALPRAVRLGGDPERTAAQVQAVQQARSDVVGQPGEGGRGDDQLRAALGVVAVLASRPGGAGVAQIRALEEVGGHLLRGHDGAAAGAGAPAAAARASASSSTASSRVTSGFPRGFFQITNPQPGFERLFQLVQPNARVFSTICPGQPGVGQGPGGSLEGGAWALVSPRATIARAVSTSTSPFSPRTVFQITNPQPGSERLFQLVQP